MDVTQALRDAENSLRDFIANVLQAKLGNDWVEHAGVSPERVAIWRQRKETEAKRQEAGVVEERILYYADFYDLATILKKNWQDFAAVFGDWKTMEVWLKELERLRDPDAHRRELLPHQKHLILGLSGEIRNRIVRYRSKEETAEDYFPRIESIRDSLGHMWVPGMGFKRIAYDTQTILRPGDVIELVVTASDPLDEKLRYGIQFYSRGMTTEWQDSAAFSVRIEDKDVAENFYVQLKILSPRPHHASLDCDDQKLFRYQVLPAKRG